jgi:hypothetical protein
MAETTVTGNISSELSSKKLAGIVRLLVAFKEAKTFAIVVAVLTFCILTPTVVGQVIEHSCESCYQMWYIVFTSTFMELTQL